MLKFGRVFPVVFLTLVATVPLRAEARAVCEELRASLAGAPTVIGNTGDVRRSANAINRLNQEIRRLRSDMRRSGCSSGSIVVFGGNSENYCMQAEADLNDMEVEKDELMRQRSGLRSGRSGILAALRENGCDEPDHSDTALTEPQDMRATLESEEGSIISNNRVFGAVDRQPTSLLPLEGEPLPLGEQLPLQQEGGLRTLCVRTCDGAFFPISSNASSQSFRHDAQICAKMCPGTQTELYYHAMIGQESADMVSAETGAPYTELPNAFSYRNRTSSKDSACGCNLNAYYEQKLKESNAGKLPKQTSTKSVTEIFTETKPETRGTIDPVPEERAYDPANSKIRQVGPQFLGDDSAAIDLKNPKGSTIQPLQ
ncbi:DUF2865 domain-containing protein [Rhizobium sp. LjRoot30]|uniref:DUF2865 domain-containing protein n=1 Tax=Rhizobium sp. LjRoot30 TaxID=3342320 RepID=UPI003ECC6F4D